MAIPDHQSCRIDVVCGHNQILKEVVVSSSNAKLVGDKAGSMSNIVVCSDPQMPVDMWPYVKTIGSWVPQSGYSPGVGTGTERLWKLWRVVLGPSRPVGPGVATSPTGGKERLGSKSPGRFLDALSTVGPRAASATCWEPAQPGPHCTTRLG